MIHKQLAPACGQIRITFELPSSVWADRIFVVGDFNQWSQAQTPMRQERDGVWRAVMDVPAGSHYEFRYLIDGNWQSDHHADGSRPNSYGSENSVIDASLSSVEHLRQEAHGCRLVQAALPRLVAQMQRKQQSAPAAKPAVRGAVDKPAVRGAAEQRAA